MLVKTIVCPERLARERNVGDCALWRGTGTSVLQVVMVLPWWLRWWSVCLQCRRHGFDPWVRKSLWRRKWQPTPGLLPGGSHGQTSLVGYSPWGCKESDTNGRLHRGTYRREGSHVLTVNLSSVKTDNQIFNNIYTKNLHQNIGVNPITWRGI